MLKLIYHTGVFGPIDLEYERPFIRVGRAEDNDLVLRHPSVELHHCLLVFRGEKVLWLPPDEPISADTDLWSLTGPELGPGDPITIGELRFVLAHSSKTVSVPDVRVPGSTTGTPGDDAGPGQQTAEPRYYCSHCRTFVLEAQVKRVGLLGHAKRNLCPNCSRLLETELSVLPQ